VGEYWEPLLVLVTGAPGSGKTTLASAIAERLDLVHVNRDAILNGLRLTVDRGGPAEIVQRGVAAFFGVQEHLLASGVSVVADGTLFADMAASVRRLRDFAEVVNVHCLASSWRDRFTARQTDRGAQQEDLDRWGALFVEHAFSFVEPLQLSCRRIEVATDDGYDPTFDSIIESLLGAAPHPRISGGVGPAPAPTAGRLSPTR
jgi:predicted kinase